MRPSAECLHCPFGKTSPLLKAFVGAGYRLRHPLDVQVTVSARLDGRAAGGMSDCLKSWLAAEKDGLPHLVEDPRATIFRLRNRRLQEVHERAILLPTDARIIGHMDDFSWKVSRNAQVRASKLSLRSINLSA